MKVYVEEKDMPKDCASCKYYVLNCSDSYSCIKQNGKTIHPNFSDGMGYRHEDCPFHSLVEHTKQVRKDVCEEIKDKLKLKEKFHPEDDFEIDYDFYYKEDVEEILEQIQDNNNEKLKELQIQGETK